MPKRWAGLWLPIERLDEVIRSQHGRRAHWKEPVELRGKVWPHTELHKTKLGGALDVYEKRPLLRAAPVLHYSPLT